MSNKCSKLALCLVLILVSVLVVLGGCKSPLGQDRLVSQENQGTVVVRIPPYAPWFGELFNNPASSTGFSSRKLGTKDSRAYMIADRAVLTVFDASSNEVLSESFDPSTFYYDPEALIAQTLTLDIGSGYTIRADIYNLDESAVEPMVSGTSVPFTVTAGASVPVSITCIPINPTLLQLDTQANFTQKTSEVNSLTGEIISLGGETWCKAVVPDDGSLLMTINLPEGEFYMGFGLFSSVGLQYPDVQYYLSQENQFHWLIGDGYFRISKLTPGETIYIVCLLIGEETNQTFSVTPTTPYTISGTITVPGIIDESALPLYSGVFLAPQFNSPMDNWIASGGGLSNGEIVEGNLVYQYSLVYDGDETAVLGAGIVNSGSAYPEPGDWMGAWDGDLGTHMNFEAGTDIEPYHFIGNVTGIDFTMQYIAATPIPISAFPDLVLRAAMKDIIGKSFTGEEGGVTDADLLALTRIDLSGRGDAYTDLTGLELCDNVKDLNLDNNNLSGCGLNQAAGTTNTVLSGMDNLIHLSIWNAQLDSLEFMVSLSHLESIHLSGNHNLSYVEQKTVNAGNFPNLNWVCFTGYDSDSNGACETMDSTDWSDFVSLLASFTNLEHLGMHNTMITPEQFDELYTNVLSVNSSRWVSIQFGTNLLDNGSLAQIATLPNIQELGLWNNPDITDLAAIEGMTSLQALYVEMCGITSLAPIQTLYDAGGFHDLLSWIDSDIRVTQLGLDLWPGKANRDVIDYLIGQGVNVLYEDGNTLTEPQ